MAAPLELAPSRLLLRHPPGGRGFELGWLLGRGHWGRGEALVHRHRIA